MDTTDNSLSMYDSIHKRTQPDKVNHRLSITLIYFMATKKKQTSNSTYDTT